MERECELSSGSCFFFFSSRRRHTRFDCDWSSDVCSSDLANIATSLRQEMGKPQSRMELLVRLLREFERDYNRFVLEGVASVVTRFEVFSSYAHGKRVRVRSEEHTSELQSQSNLVCRLLLEKRNKNLQKPE